MRNGGAWLAEPESRTASLSRRLQEEPSAPCTLWVKPMHTPDASFVATKGVDVRSELVDDLRTRVATRLGVHPYLLKLSLAPCGARKPTAEQEKGAVELDDPSLTLEAAGITGTSWLLAFVAGSPGDFGGSDALQMAVPAPAALQAFWKELPNATVVDNVLQLSSGTTFHGDVDLPDRMYIRADYVGLWDELESMLLSGGFSKVVVSGNPGIGKSWFGIFVAYKLMTRSKPPTIVWEARRSCTRVLVQGGRVLRGSLSSFVDELEDRSTWYLVDEAAAPGPVHKPARTIVFSSPNRDNYKNFLDAVAATLRYLPVWSWEEIDTCRRLLYAHDPERTPERVLGAYLRWGGIPRYVLEKLADVSAQQELPKAIARSDLAALVNAVGALDSAPATSHRVLHIITSAPYVEVQIDFGSDFIRARIADLLLSRQKTELFRFVTRESDPVYAQLRGCFFEALAHERLSAGGSFPTRLLIPRGTGLPVISSLTLEKKQTKRFSGTDPSALRLLLSYAPGDYCRPLADTFPVLDALILPNMLLQMTVSDSHSVNEAKLARILDALQISGTVELVFIVPTDKFDEFKMYNFKDPALNKRVVQKAVHLAFDFVM